MSKLEYTSSSAIETKYQEVAAGFHGGVTTSLDFRREQLRNLYYALADNEAELQHAVEVDLHRSSAETSILELNECLSEITLAITNLDDWAADTKLPTLTGDMRFALSKSVVRKTPYGVVLIIGPWNYPYLCTVAPLVAAIAAGNTVVLKPTEVATESTRVLSRILESALDSRIFRAVVGGVPETTQLLKYRWDKIMITGSGRVGKIVSHAAAENLTPVCLELGGKSPVIIGPSANLKLIAKRIAWGKFVNAGQTCIAPDYAIVDRKVARQFVHYFKEAVKGLYPDLSTAGSQSRDYGHIITEGLFDRAEQIVEASQAKEKWQWGVPDRSQLFFPPTVLYGGLTLEDSSLASELFNPTLPILEVDDIVSEAPQIIKNYHDYPLALYLFTEKKDEQEQILNSTRSGSVMINDVLTFGGSPIIPFGGVGHSGVGRYHGKYGFDEFTHERPVVVQPSWLEKLIEARYPPYTSHNVALLKLLSRPQRLGFGRTGKVKGRGCLCRLVGFLFRKFGLTVLILAIIFHLR